MKHTQQRDSKGLNICLKLFFRYFKKNLPVLLLFSWFARCVSWAEVPRVGQTPQNRVMKQGKWSSLQPLIVNEAHLDHIGFPLAEPISNLELEHFILSSPQFLLRSPDTTGNLNAKCYLLIVWRKMSRDGETSPVICRSCQFSFFRQ